VSAVTTRLTKMSSAALKSCGRIHILPQARRRPAVTSYQAAQCCREYCIRGSRQPDGASRERRRALARARMR
jgi:hypothetical protein